MAAPYRSPLYVAVNRAFGRFPPLRVFPNCSQASQAAAEGTRRFLPTESGSSMLPRKAAGLKLTLNHSPEGQSSESAKRDVPSPFGRYIQTSSSTFKEAVVRNSSSERFPPRMASHLAASNSCVHRHSSIQA